MTDYKVTRRWYTVQMIQANNEEDAAYEAGEATLLAEDFYEEGDEEIEEV